MPKTLVVFYREASGRCQIVEWLRALRAKDRRAYAKCVARIHDLISLGHELRRPRVDSLADGIHELRVRMGRVHYRMLYFFHGPGVAVVTRGFKKLGKIPRREIERAMAEKRRFKTDPFRFSYMEGDEP